MSMSVDGLISGMDTTSLIAGLLQAEAAPQAALKTRLATMEKAASAYRTVNTTFLAVSAAAEAALKPAAFTATRATSSDTSVAISSSSSALAGSLAFTVDQLATAHSVFQQNPDWTSADADFGSSSLTIAPIGGGETTTLTFDPGASLADVAAKINAGDHALSAAVVRVDDGKFALQVTAKKTGAANVFDLTGAGIFTVNTQGKNAKLTIGVDNAYAVHSDTNTFASVLPGTTITVSKLTEGRVTVNVANDPDAVATTVQKLVDAVNAALSTVKTYTNNAKGSTAALKGDFPVTQLGGRLLDAVSFAVGGKSPATVGIELTRDGKMTFDKAKFAGALAADPALGQRMIAGAPPSTDHDGAPVSAVAGIADRLLQVAKAASDSATGALVKLAEGQDSMGKDIQDRIEAWDLRLAKRKDMLTRQFSAMETALSGLRNQSTWLAGQINSLPTSS
jgi:flagellar capping protein FliD